MQEGPRLKIASSWDMPTWLSDPSIICCLVVCNVQPSVNPAFRQTLWCICACRIALRHLFSSSVCGMVAKLCTRNIYWWTLVACISQVNAVQCVQKATRYKQVIWGFWCSVVLILATKLGAKISCLRTPFPKEKKKSEKVLTSCYCKLLCSAFRTKHTLLFFCILL